MIVVNNEFVKEKHKLLLQLDKDPDNQILLGLLSVAEKKNEELVRRALEG